MYIYAYIYTKIHIYKYACMYIYFIIGFKYANNIDLLCK